MPHNFICFLSLGNMKGFSKPPETKFSRENNLFKHLESIVCVSCMLFLFVFYLFCVTVYGSKLYISGLSVIFKRRNENHQSDTGHLDYIAFISLCTPTSVVMCSNI